MIDFDKQLEIFKLIGKTLEREVECYAIGGTAMLFLGLKDSTKDVDLVFETEKNRNIMKKALDEIGFKEKNEIEIYRHKEVIKEPPLLLRRDDFRFDLFLRDIISFKLSPGIKERVRERHEFDKFKLFVVSPEDILLLKSATDRKGDRVDAKKIIETFNIKWDVVIKECEWQTEKGRKIFSIFLYDFLEELKEMETEIPKNIIKKVRDIGEKKMLEIIRNKKN